MHEVRQFVLWGSSGHAKVLADAIILLGGRVVALFDNANIASAIPNVPIFIGETGFQSWAKTQGALINHIAGLVAIGGGGGHDRIHIQKLFREYGLKTPVLCHPSAVVSPKASIGLGTQILALANVAADSILGEACIINHHASVDHECKLGNGVHLAPGATLCGCVSIGDNVYVGAGSVILPRLHIGKGSTIGAGAVVTKDVPLGVTVVGNPAQPVNRSKSEMYNHEPKS